MTALSVVQITEIKALIDTLAELGISPLHLHIDTKHGSAMDTRPDISMWCQTRTDFERLCAHLKAKPRERSHLSADQRQWYAEHDHAGRRLLIQVVSLAHHDDWERRPDRTPASDLLGLLEEETA